MSAPHQAEGNVAHNLAREWVTEHLETFGLERATVTSENRGPAPVFPTLVGEHQDPVPDPPHAYFSDVEIALPSSLTEAQVDKLIEHITTEQASDRALGGRVGRSRLNHEEINVTQEDSHDQGAGAWRIRLPFVIHDPGDPAPD